ncbi:MAG: hypothetical protein AVDCRST_MAG39-2643, partial [uncultured Sphingomonadaceae bacterium]
WPAGACSCSAPPARSAARWRAA